MRRGLLAILGAGIVLVLFSLFTTPTYPSDYGLVIRMDSTDLVWQTEKEETITFESNPLSRLLTTYKVKITFHYEYDSEEGRVTTLTYRIYSNDIYVENITDSYNINSGSGGGGFGPLKIPFETLRAGENTVRVHISFNSTVTEPRTRPDSIEFHINSAVITDNFRFIALILLSLTSIGIIYVFRDSIFNACRQCGRIWPPNLREGPAEVR